MPVEEQQEMGSMSTPPSSPGRQRKQQAIMVIQPWWILAFAFVQMLVFVFLSEGVPSASTSSHGDTSIDNESDDIPPLIQRNVRSLDIGKVAVDRRIEKLQLELKKKLNATKVTVCQRYKQEGNKVIMEDTCQDSTDTVIAYNPASYDRIWCGTTAPAKGFILLTKLSCRQEPPRIWSTHPTVQGKAMPAVHIEPYMPHIILPSFQNKKRNVTNIPCNIPCQKTVGADVFSGTDYRVVGTDFKILHSLESSQYYGNLRIKENAFRENQYYSTTSFRSEIPVPYYSIQQDIAKPAVDFDEAIQGASFIAHNCDSRNNRELVVRELMNYIRVDSLSSCLHNAELPNGTSLQGGSNEKKKVMHAYLFHLAFENSQEDDYITEKLWDALESGTLPVYLGAPNVKEYTPPNSIISWHDFESTKELALYMNKVASNKSLYQLFHAWRTKPLPESFQQKFDFTKTDSICRMCRWAYAKRFGLGWNHDRQTVEDLTVSRQAMYDSKHRLIHPFREAHDLPNDTWKRSVFEHDGVIDIYMTPLGKRANHNVYRMETAIRGQFREYEKTFMIQNDASRITVLTSWDAEVANPETGTIEVLLEPSLGILRLRVMVEDLDTFHKGAVKETNYFGDFMSRDFFDPIQTFLVVGSNLTSVSS
jgi:hypothetical protein